VRWPAYPLDAPGPSAWPSRGALLAYEAALARAAAVDDALEVRAGARGCGRGVLSCCQGARPGWRAWRAAPCGLADTPASLSRPQAGDTARAWRCLEPVLAALRAGEHKAVTWDCPHAPLPNPPPAPGPDADADADAAPAAAADLGPPAERDQQQQAQQQEAQGQGQQLDQAQQQDEPEWWQQQQAEQEWQQQEEDDPAFFGAGGSDSAPCSPRQRQEKEEEEEEAQLEDQQEAQREEAGGKEAAEPAEVAEAANPVPAAAASASPRRPLFLARFSSGWVYASLGTIAVSLLERERRYAEAVDLLQLLLGGNACLARRGTWWGRLSINLEHLKRPDDALEAAEAALADPYVRHGDRLFLQRRVLRLGKPPRRWKRPAWAAAAAAEPPEHRVTGRPLAGSVGSRNRWAGGGGGGSIHKGRTPSTPPSQPRIGPAVPPVLNHPPPPRLLCPRPTPPHPPPPPAPPPPSPAPIPPKVLWLRRLPPGQR
jgi:hypothetical protein